MEAMALQRVLTGWRRAAGCAACLLLGWGSAAAQLALPPEAEPLPEAVVESTRQSTAFSLALQAELDGDHRAALASYRELARTGSTPPSLHVRIAACLLELEEYESALAAARRAVTADSTLVEGYWIEALTLLRQRELEAALRPLERAGRMRPELRTLQLWATILERLGRLEAALEPLDELVRLRPRRFLLQRARLLARLGRYEEALEDYQEIYRQDPTRDEVAVQMGRLMTQLQRLDDLIALHRNRLELDPDDSAARRDLIGALIQAERWEEARQQAERLHAQQPDDPLALLQLGLVTYRLGESAEALALLDRAYEMEPEGARILRWRMRLQLSERHFDAALESASRLLQVRRGDAEAARGRAIALAETGRPVAALNALRQWSEFDRQNPEPLEMAAELLLAQGESEAALVALGEAVRRVPEDLLLALQYATRLEAAGRQAAADSVILPRLSAHPDEAVLLNYYGYTLVERDSDLGRAEQLIRRALDQEPENPAFLDSMGWLCYKKGQLRSAEQWLQRAVEHEGRHGEIFLHLARVQLARGDRAAARRTVERGLRWNEGHAELQELLKTLRDKQ